MSEGVRFLAKSPSHPDVNLGLLNKGVMLHLGIRVWVLGVGGSVGLWSGSVGARLALPQA